MYVSINEEESITPHKMTDKEMYIVDTSLFNSYLIVKACDWTIWKLFTFHIIGNS